MTFNTDEAYIMVIAFRLTLMLQVAYLTIQNYAKKLKMTETLAYGYSLRILGESYHHDRV